MNRRELILGLSAALVAAKIPVPTELDLAIYGRSPMMEATDLIKHLERIRLELIDRLCNPPYILYANGKMEQMSLKEAQKALECINIALKELYEA